MPHENAGTHTLAALCPAELTAARRGGSAPDRYLTPSPAQRAAFTALVSALLREPERRAELDARAAALGYRLVDVAEIPGALLLRELPTQRRGGGAYLFSARRDSGLIVQAPHTFFDEGTLPLACELFRDANARALFIDTAHRYKAAGVDERGDYPADVAHARDSLFQAATAGALEAVPLPTFVQLHGFAARESGAAIVLSSGASEREASLPTRARAALSPIVTGPVQRFPDETVSLGATTNVQGEIVRAAGGAFLHVEMSADLRHALLANAPFRARFLGNLGSCLERP